MLTLMHEYFENPLPSFRGFVKAISSQMAGQRYLPKPAFGSGIRRRRDLQAVVIHGYMA